MQGREQKGTLRRGSGRNVQLSDGFCSRKGERGSGEVWDLIWNGGEGARGRHRPKGQLILGKPDRLLQFLGHWWAEVAFPSPRSLLQPRAGQSGNLILGLESLGPSRYMEVRTAVLDVRARAASQVASEDLASNSKYSSPVVYAPRVLEGAGSPHAGMTYIRVHTGIHTRVSSRAQSASLAPFWISPTPRGYLQICPLA